MKLSTTTFPTRRLARGGWALLAVMTLAAAGLMVMAGVMSWANENATVAGRNNEYFADSYAAEAATEKVLSSLSQQYQNYGFSLVNQNMASYAATTPSSSDDPYWTNFTFSGGHTSNSIIVTNTATSQSVVLGAPYSGLTLKANTYEIIANAQTKQSQFNIVSTVGQQLYLGTIPLFQFAIFYQNDMEIAPGANMTVTGTVHGNANIYLEPQSGMSFTGNVSASGSNVLGESPLDPSLRSFSGVNFSTQPVSGVDPLNLPVGTNTAGGVSNMSQNVYGILQPPTGTQGPTSSTGTNLLYNKADMIIVISNNNAITVTSGAGVNNQATVISNAQWQTFLSTNGGFYDQRDSLNVNPITINVSNLVNWSATNTVLRPVLSSLRGSGSSDVQSIYVDDMRSTSNMVITTNYTLGGTNYTTNASTTTAASLPATGSYVMPPMINTVLTTNTTAPATGTYMGSVTHSGSKYIYNRIVNYTYYGINAIPFTNTTYLTNWSLTSQPGVVLTNGAILPPQGLSIATPDPAYIIGNWNIKTSPGGSSDAGLTDTAYTRPSAVYSDAITVLSSAWNPANSTQGINNRMASSDTVNAAFLTGNVPSDGNTYSGGVENFPRFLENWNGQTFTYNGSMVAMFSSQIANAPWPGTGTVYNPPTRIWAYDLNFNDPAKQPPMTPQVISVQRSQWTMLKPYATSF